MYPVDAFSASSSCIRGKGLRHAASFEEGLRRSSDVRAPVAAKASIPHAANLPPRRVVDNEKSAGEVKLGFFLDHTAVCWSGRSRNLPTQTLARARHCLARLFDLVAGLYALRTTRHAVTTICTSANGNPARLAKRTITACHAARQAAHREYSEPTESVLYRWLTGGDSL